MSKEEQIIELVNYICKTNIEKYNNARAATHDFSLKNIYQEGASAIEEILLDFEKGLKFLA